MGNSSACFLCHDNEDEIGSPYEREEKSVAPSNFHKDALVQVDRRSRPRVGSSQLEHGPIVISPRGVNERRADNDYGALEEFKTLLLNEGLVVEDWHNVARGGQTPAALATGGGGGGGEGAGFSMTLPVHRTGATAGRRTWPAPLRRAGKKSARRRIYLDPAATTLLSEPDGRRSKGRTARPAAPAAGEVAVPVRRVKDIRQGPFPGSGDSEMVGRLKIAIRWEHVPGQPLDCLSFTVPSMEAADRFVDGLALLCTRAAREAAAAASAHASRRPSRGWSEKSGRSEAEQGAEMKAEDTDNANGGAGAGRGWAPQPGGYYQGGVARAPVDPSRR